MIKDLTIYTATGAVRAQITLNSGAKGKYTLGTDDYITLPFTLRDPVLFAIGDWVDLAPLATENGLWGRFAKRYIITEQPKPSWSNSTGGYDYDLRLDAYYMAWRTKIFKYLPKDGMAEASWDLTDTLSHHLDVFIANLEAMAYKYNGDTAYDYSIDGTVEDKALPLSYSNTNMVDALTAMAEAWDCDWWMEEQTICFGRCEGGDEIDIEIGKEAESMTRSDSSGTYANRLYVFGSDRNVPLKYRKSLIFTVTNSDGDTIEDGARHLKTSMFPNSDKLDATREMPFSDWNGHYEDYTIPYGGVATYTQTWGKWCEQGYCTFDPGAAYIAVQEQTTGSKCYVRATITVYGDGDNMVTIATKTTSAEVGESSTGYIYLPAATMFYLTEACNVWIKIEWTFTDRYGGGANTIRLTCYAAAPQLVYTNPYPAVRVETTFLTGDAAGYSYVGTLNQEEDSDHENIITLGTLPVGTPFPAIGDTFTIDNIVSNDIPATWYTLDGDAVLTDGIVSDRLRLPAGYNYIDGYRYLAGQRVFLGSDGYDDPAAEEMPIEEAVEEVLINEDIYPRTETTVDGVDSYDDEILDDSGEGTGQYETFYRIHTDALVFSADYCIPGQTLGVRFTSGKLNGMEFEVNFNPDGKAEDDPAAQWFEILANDDYGRTLPDTVLCPAEGDTFILYGWDSTYIETLGLVAAAEQELLDYAIDEMKKMMVDDGVYSVQLFPAWVYGDLINRTFDVGQRINLINAALFDDGRHSRVIGIEMALDIPYDKPTYSIGESQRYSRLGALETKIENITYRGTTYSVYGTGGDGTGGDGSSVYLIKTNDSTAPTNSNAYSAQRSIAMFLRKDSDDSTPYDLAIGGALTVDGASRLSDTIIAGSISSPQFADGFDGYGWRLWNRGTDGDDHHLTVDSLTVRRTMTVYELLIQKIRAIGGQFIISAANGTIATVDTFTDDTGLLMYAITLEDANEFVAHDLMRCQTFTGEALKSYWVEIDSVAGDTIFVSASEFSLRNIPEVGDEVVLCGNTTNTERQSVIILSATEGEPPRIDLHDGVNSKAFSSVAKGETLGTLRVRTGKLDDISDDWFPADRQPSGYGLYGGNAYLRGTFVLADSGDDVSTLFQVIQGNITALITANEQANYLSNSTFANDMSGWVVGDGCAIVYDTLAGRNVLEMAASGRTTASMVQLSSNYAMQPTFDKDEEGNIIARNFNLQFYAYGAGAYARFYMQGGDTTLDEALEFDLREWTYYDIAFTAKSFGDFTMTVSTGSLHLHDVRIVADNVTYFTTLFSQTVGSISALGQRVETVEGQISDIWAAGFITATDVPDLIDDWFGDNTNIDAFAAMFAAAVDVNDSRVVSALLGTFVGKTYNEATGEWELESTVVIYGDQLLLAGYVDINNGRLTIDKEGNLTANNATFNDGTFSGKITTDTGYIGGFVIANLGLEEDPARGEGKSAKAHITFDEKDIDGTFMYLSSDQLDIEDNSTYKNSKLLAGNVASGIGNDVTVLALTAAPAVGIESAIVTGISISVVNGTADDNNVRAGTHALLIEHGDICGFRLRTRRFVNEDAYLSSMDSIAVIRCDSPQNVYLPEDAEDGQVIIVKHLGERDGYIIVYAQGQDKISTDTYSTNPSNATGQIRSGQWRIFFYDSANNLWHMGITSE